ncbi:MAG: hypothetical protein V4512_06870 [Pseudomonadota bacterium]
MSMDYICRYYDVPAKSGGRIRYSGGRHPAEGTIVSAEGAHLLIRLDGQEEAMPYHPTWKIEYLPDSPAVALLTMWVITENPTDHPGRFVARQWIIGRNRTSATAEHHIADTLEQVRAMLPPFLTMIPRDSRDDRVIVESWI